MFKKILIILILGLLVIPFSFADENVTAIDDNSYSDIYFDSSVANDGNGSIDNPYKYLTSDRIKSDSNLYFADGEYELEKTSTISSFNAFIGRSAQNTIINANGMFSNSGTLRLCNLTLKNPYIYNTGILTADNVIFRDSASSDFGGVINNQFTSSNDVNAAPISDLNNCSFVNNSARYGGVIFSFKSVVLISNSSFDNNSAYQGGILYSFKSTVNINNSTFRDNHASIGGIICDLNSETYLDSLNVINCTAVYQGGAVYKMYGALTLNASSFTDNSADEGEAVFCDNSTFVMSSNEFRNNDVYSILSTENFTDNSFIQSELYQLDSYDINFVSSNYTRMFYIPYNGTIPSRYDLREQGLVTPAKDQGNDGNCWAFAALGALESCILRATGQVYDLSEENMKNLIALYSDYGWKMDTNNGGYDNMAIGYLSSWMGPVNDSDDEYIVNSFLSPLIDSVMHVQNILYVSRSNFTENDDIKRAILNYGGVYTGIGYYGTYTRSYNYYNYGNSKANHGVVIVGWDDNYSKSNFRTAPPGNGAWICKNSWGSSWGDGGYFYVSYYDITCARVGDSKSSFTFILNDTVRYDKNYQYDVIGITDYFLTNQSSIWYQNNFNATSDETIAAFSTYFNLESNFTVEIYVNNELKLMQTGSSPSGYFTVNLDEFIPVYKNDLFKIILKITTDTEAWVPISESISSTRTHYRPNTSFISYDGINWIDFYDYALDMSERGHNYYSQVACIKAFSIFNLTTVTNITQISTANNHVNFIATVSDQYGHKVNEGNVIFEYGGLSYDVGVCDGTAFLSLENINSTGLIKAIYQNNVHYLSSECEVSYDIPKSDMNLSLKLSDIYYGDYLQVNVSLSTAEGEIIDNNLTLEIDNRSYAVSSNSLFTIPYLLDAGCYNVTLTFTGNNLYNACETSSVVIVRKYDVNLTLDISDVTYGEYLKVNSSLTDNGNPINGILVLNVANKSYSFSANNEFIIPDILNASSYDVNVCYCGNERYNAVNLTSAITVFKKEVFVDAEITKIINNATISVELSEMINATLCVLINNQSYSLCLVNGENTLKLDNLDLGFYNVEFSLNDNYQLLYSEYNFTIDSIYTLINVNNITMYYRDGTRLSVFLTDSNANPLSGKLLRITLNGTSYSRRTNSAGLASINLALRPGIYQANVEFSGDDNYFSSSRNISVDIRSTIIADDLTKYYRNSSQFYATLLDYSGNPIANSKVSMKINGIIYNRTTNSDGVVRLNINLYPGKYVLDIYNPLTNEKSSYIITVLSVIVDNKDLIKYYKNDSQYQLKVLDAVGLPLAGVKVSFNLNGLIYTRTTDENGIATLRIILSPGDYIITAEYNGLKVSNSIKVLSLLEANDLTMTYRDGSKFEVKLFNGQGNPYYNQKIRFKINNVIYQRNTDNNGIASLKINLVPGEYIIISSYNESQISNVVTVKSS